MKNAFLTVALLGAALTTTFADQVEKSTTNVIQRDGTFYSIFDTINQGKLYYQGQWFEPDADWRTSIAEVAAQSGIFADEYALASYFGYTKQPGNTGDPDRMLEELGIGAIASMSGVTLQKLLLTPAKKATLLDEIAQGVLSNADFQELLQVSENPTFMPNYLLQNGDNYIQNVGYENDPEFTNAFLAAIQQYKPERLQDAYASVKNTYSPYQPNGLELVDLSGWETPNLEFFPVNKANLTWSQINSSENYTTADFSGMDVSNLVTTGKSFGATDFSNTNITGAQLNAANNIANAKLNGTNIAGFSATGKDISYINLTGANGITGANINGATNYRGIDFGNIDITGFNPPAGTTLQDVNLSNVVMNPSAFNNVVSFHNSNLSGQNLTGLVVAGKSLNNVNIENTTGLTAQAIAQATYIQGMNLRGTGITQAQMNTALQNAGKTGTYGFDTNQMQFDPIP